MFNLCNKISKISIYLLIFLLPLFFLPWTTNILDFNKQTLLVFLVFLSLFSWLLKSLKEGKLSLNLSRFNITIAVFLIVMTAVTIFSSYQYGSFWGLPLNVGSSFLTILSFALLYFLIINIFKKTELFGLFFTLAFSSFLAVLFGGFQLFSRFFLPFDFAQISSFNTIGTVNSLAVFAALFFPLLISLIFISKRFIKFLLIIFAATFLGLIFLINFWVAWISLLIGMAVILIFGIARREFFKGWWLSLTMVILVISLFFGVFRISIPGLPATPLEVSPSQTATFSIAGQTLKESPSNLLLGSGQGTFVYDYAKFKSETINQTAFWGIRFSSGGSEVLDKLATTGILGLISFLGILIVFLLLGFKTLVKNVSIRKEMFIGTLGLGIFASWLAVAISFFLYPANLSLGFLFCFFTASFIVFSEKPLKTWELKTGHLANVGISLFFIFILIFGIGILFLEGQRYIAEIRYSQGINAEKAGDNQKAINYILSAISYSSGSQDNYWRDLSQIYLFRIKEELQKQGVSTEQVSEIVTPLVSNAVNSAKQATDIASNNVANWLVRGYVYRNVINLIGGASDWAVKSYEKAGELEPANPYVWTELGRVYLAEEDNEKAKEQFEKALSLKPDYASAHFQLANISILEGKTEEAIEKMETARRMDPSDVGLTFQLGALYYQNDQLTKAQEEFEIAISLNENYSNARYFLGLIYDKKGKKIEAISQFEKIAILNPNNEEVREILNNLKAGRQALEGIEETTLIEEKPEELE